MKKTQKKTIKRIVSLMLCLILVITSLPDSFIIVVADELSAEEEVVVVMPIDETTQAGCVGGEVQELVEIIELRDKYSKTYELADGSRTAIISSLPVHYEDEESGRWENIDNTLTKTIDDSGNTFYKNKNNDFT